MGFEVSLRFLCLFQFPLIGGRARVVTELGYVRDGSIPVG
jgi:hypothetical protein